MLLAKIRNHAVVALGAAGLLGAVANFTGSRTFELLPRAEAFGSYLTAFKNRYPNTTLDTRLSCTLCHTSEAYGAAVNCYKRDLAALGSGVPIADRINSLNAIDSDNDGVPNGIEAEAARSGGTVGYSPGLVGAMGTDPCGANTSLAVSSALETPPDSDGDGVADPMDGCPNDPLKTSPGTCGCGSPDTDSDGDGVLNCLDGCPNDAAKTSPGACGCGVADTDSDGDGVANCIDQCPGVDDNADADNDGLADCLEGAAFTVNTTADTVDANPGNGVCADANGACSLRAAIMEANADSNGSVIVIPAGTYTLTISGFDMDATQGDLNITEDVVIEGAGARSTIIDGGQLDTVIDCGSHQSNITISGVTIRNGLSMTFGSGGIASTDNVLTLNDCTISGNTLSHASSYGGGVYAGGTLNMNRCTVSGNTVNATSTGRGGGVCVTYGGTCAITNCTISGNTVNGAMGGSGGGLAILGSNGTINNCTIVNNTANTSAGGLYFDSNTTATLTVRNTIVANNTGGGCDWPLDAITSGGNNLDSTNSCNFVASGDLANATVTLGALANNGGPTDTHMPAAGSTPVDWGSNSSSAATDQRGRSRPVDGNSDNSAVSDIGAVERADCNNDGVEDGTQTDSDGDGLIDACDPCPASANNTADVDNDGTLDCVDGCPNDAAKTAPGACGCGNGETDSDGDGTPDCVDGCPSDAAKTAPGPCGCGSSDVDSDGDGFRDCVDLCPNDASKNTPGECGCGSAETDTDDDGVPDCDDNCPANHNPEQADADRDGIGDNCDFSTFGDGDGSSDGGNEDDGDTSAEGDLDGDGIVNAQDTDDDGDGINDDADDDDDNDGIPDDAEGFVEAQETDLGEMLADRACAEGACGAAGFAQLALMFVGLAGIRRRMVRQQR